MKTLSQRVAAARKQIGKMGDHFQVIPFEEMQNILKRNDLVAIQEDGAEWAGMFLGDTGHCTIPVVEVEQANALRLNAYQHLLVISWYRQATRYEVIKYVS